MVKIEVNKKTSNVKIECNGTVKEEMSELIAGVCAFAVNTAKEQSKNVLTDKVLKSLGATEHDAAKAVADCILTNIIDALQKASKDIDGVFDSVGGNE